MMPSFPAVVAASGLSSRMGTSKPLLDAGGRSFLARVVEALKGGGGDPVLVVLRSVQSQEAEEARSVGGIPVLNPDPSSGPISSLQAGILALPEHAPGTLFTPADHPLFQPATVALLVAAFLDSNAPLAAPSYGGRPGHPVVFGSTLFPELLQGDLPQGARTVVHRYLESRLLIPVNDPGILVDIDTPEDYRRHLPRK